MMGRLYHELHSAHFIHYFIKTLMVSMPIFAITIFSDTAHDATPPAAEEPRSLAYALLYLCK